MSDIVMTTDSVEAVERLMLDLGDDWTTGFFEDSVVTRGEDIAAVLSERDRLISRITELEKALGPFAALANAHDRYYPSREDATHFLDGPDGFSLLWGDFRNAARAHANKDG